MLARNLGLALGDELVLLGTAEGGGVAATVVQIVGIFSSGQPAIDRAVLHIDGHQFREAWNLPRNSAHVIGVLADSVAAVGGVEQALLQHRQPGQVVRRWETLMPDLEHMITLKRTGQDLFFIVIVVIVAFSVVNTFMMVVFERTREIGMLRALGMSGSRIQRMLHVEALLLAVLGCLLGTAIATAMVVPLTITGVLLPEQALEAVQQIHMPDRLTPIYAYDAVLIASVVLVVGTQLSVLLPALRARRLQPAAAMAVSE